MNIRVFLALVIGLAILIAVPFTQSDYGIFVLSDWLVLSVAAMGLNLTLGYAGQVSLAQAAFVGIGAYTTALLTMVGIPWPLAVLASILICFVVGIGVGYPALKVQHHFLAFVTLAFNALTFLVMRNEEWLTNGTYGLVGIPRPAFFGTKTDSPLAFYFFSLAVFVIMTAVLWWMVRSSWGRAFRALRENPMRANSLGVDIRRYTLLAFAIGSAFGGVAGAMLAPLVQYIDPNSFTLDLSLKILLMVVVGGSGYFFGPLLGTLIVVIAPEALRFTEGYYLILYAAIVIILMIFCPSGLFGLGEKIRNRFVVRKNPSATIWEQKPREAGQ